MIAHAGAGPQPKGLNSRLGGGRGLRPEVIGAPDAPLPKCLELLDRWHGETMTVEELDKIAPADLDELGKAYAQVWEGHIESTFAYKPGG